MLGLPTQRVRVIQPVVGGAFGGKSEPFSLEFCAAKLSMIIGRPVKILYTREEVFYAHRGRHPMRLHYRTGISREGKLTGTDARVPGPGQLVTPGDHVLTLTGQALRLTLGPLTGGSPSARHQHTVVVVPLDSAGRRRGEQVALVHVRDAS